MEKVDIEKINERKPISIYKCVNDLGANELMDILKKSDNIIETISWPLSVIT